MNSSERKTSQAIIDLFLDRGDSEYGGEAVTQCEHALQAATLAERCGAPPTLIVAALLHDIGHLLHELPDDAPDGGIDDRHETAGYDFLRSMFPDSVCEPVRMHVDAKRYLCAIDEAYFDSLSEPSRVSLRLQGGPMGQSEATEFSCSPFCDAAIKLRQWDDQAKVVGMKTPTLDHFRSFLDTVIGEDESSC